MNLRDLQHLLRPIRTALANTIARGTLKLLDDAKKFQAVQVELLEDEIRDDVERIQEYGFTSVPLEGAETVVAFIGGRRDHGVVIKCDDRRYRLKGLEKGEVAMYTDQGDKVVFKRGGTLEIHASTKVKIFSPLVEMTTDLKVTGNVEVVGTTALKGATTVGTVSAPTTFDVKGAIDATSTIHSSTTITGVTDVVGGSKSLKNHTHPAGSYAITEVGAGGSVDSVTGSSGAPS